MAVYKKPLYDKDGNQVYPDVGLELDDVIYGSDPGQVETPSPWIETGDIKDNQITSAKIGWSSMEHWSIVLPRDKTVSNTSAYQYKDVPDGSITINAVVGGVYLVLMNAAMCCTTAGTDCYVKVLLNGGNLILGSAQTTAANKFATLSGAQTFTASQVSNTIKLQLGGGAANSSYMIAGTVASSVQIIRIA